MMTLGKVGEVIGALLAIPFTVLVFYVLYLLVAWSWGLLLYAICASFAGVLLLSVAESTQAGKETGIMGRIISHSARGFATSAFAVAAGLVLTAFFQSVVLSRDPLDVRELQEFEEQLLYVKVWLEHALGLDVLAGILVLVIVLSVLLPAKSLLQRTLSARRVASFAYVILLTLTSFTFFAGLALKPYEMSLRSLQLIKATSAYERNYLDRRKSLVAIAWMINELSDPTTPQIPSDLAQRLSEYAHSAPFDGELENAAWRIAGFDTVLYLSEDDTRRNERHTREVNFAAREIDLDISEPRLVQLRQVIGGIFGGTFSELTAKKEPQAWQYLQVLRKIEPRGAAQQNWADATLNQSCKAAQEILSNLLAEKIGGVVTGEELGRHFVGELVQAVVTPLWDVILPLDINNVASARAFVANQKLDRAALDWSKLSEIPLVSQNPPPSTSVEASGAASTGIGTSSPQAVPLGALPSWQTFSGPPAFVYHPNVGVPEVYTRPTFRVR